MKHRRLQSFFIVMLIVGCLTFILTFAGIRGLLNQPVVWSNALAFTVFSLICGSLAGLFYSFRLMAALYLYLAGLVGGFIMMYVQFLSMGDGWGDLAGLLSLLLFTIIGLVAGLIVQLIWYLVNRAKKPKQ